MPSAAILIVAAVMCPGCAARDDNVEAAVEQREEAPARQSETLARPVLLETSRGNGDPEAARTFKSYGVGPTIDTGEESTSRVDLDLDTASFALARAAIASGELPVEASVRVEEFLAAIPPASAPPAQIAIEVDSMASPQRSGYELVRIAIRVPRGKSTPVDVVFAIDGSAAIQEEDRIPEALLAAARAMAKEDRLGVVLVGAQAQELVPLGTVDTRALTKALHGLHDTAPQTAVPDLGLPAVYRGFDPARSAHLVALTTGVLPDTRVHELVAREAAAGRRTSALGFGEGPYDDTTLERIAHAGRGRYGFVDDAADAIEHARKPVIAIAPRLTVRFDPAAVTLYRLIGYESRSGERTDDGSEPSVLVAGDTATVLYEIKLAAEPPARWGEAELHFTSPADGKVQTMLQPIEKPTRAGTDMQLAAIAAGMAEKLRGSYWARRLTWSDLHALHRKLPASVRKRADVAELGRLVNALGKLDQRRDRFESRSPQARMDFDRLPVIE